MLNLLETYARLNDNPPIIRASFRTCCIIGNFLARNFAVTQKNRRHSG